MADNIKPTSIRLDTKLFEKIKADAEKEKRSIEKRMGERLNQEMPENGYNGAENERK